jgi:serine/threonine-protein kinase
MAPEKLGKYRLLTLLATGGMGEVFLARQDGPAGFSKTVVIKRILRHLASDQSFVDMFVNEARLAGLLQHPNIVQIFELQHDGEEWFIAMEYVHGRSLHAVIEACAAKGTRADPRIAARICAQALQGLQFAHQLKDQAGQPLGILHRDMSPDNVLVSFSGGVKLVDFGIAKAMNASSVTHAGTVKGKVSYMAPEQFMPDTVLDARTDVYAMGVTLHEVLTNDRPSCVPANTDEALTKPRVGFTRRHDLHASLNDILEKALYPNPQDRFASADDMAHALEGFIAATGDPLTPARVSEWMVELFGKEAADQNTAVAPRGNAPPGTDVLSAPYVLPAEGQGQALGDIVQAAPTMVEKRLQGLARNDTDPPRPAIAPKRDLRIALLALGGLLMVGAGAGVAFMLRGPKPVPVADIPPPPRPEPVQRPRTRPKLPPPEPSQEAAAAIDSDGGGESVAEVERPHSVRKRVVPRPGRVTVRVNPWAEVIYEGRSYGVTPVSPITVPAGTATFTLKNKQLGVTKKVSIRVPPGGEVVLKADLFKAKPN